MSEGLDDTLKFFSAPPFYTMYSRGVDTVAHPRPKLVDNLFIILSADPAGTECLPKS